MNMTDEHFNELTGNVEYLRKLVDRISGKAEFVEIWRNVENADPRINTQTCRDRTEDVLKDTHQAAALLDLITAQLDFEAVLRSADDEDTDYDTYLLAKNDLVISKHRWAAAAPHLQPDLDA
tara:strand:+ start:397 stop:762 length:366 start_codon:yes stop_codon:yes gene_type:complete